MKNVQVCPLLTGITDELCEVVEHFGIEVFEVAPSIASMISAETAEFRSEYVLRKRACPLLIVVTQGIWENLSDSEKDFYFHLQDKGIIP